jgi:salicylate hydroxylase
MATPRAVDTLVVGGGIGGLATALAIARGGGKVHLLERNDDFTEIGAGLQFGPNASRALDRLGVLSDAMPMAVRPERAVFMDAIKGTPLTVLQFGQAFERRYGYPYLVLHRHDLLEILLKHCRENELITLETQRNVVDSTVESDRAEVICEDGSRYVARSLIAADGLYSVLRHHVVADEPECSGYAAYRGTIPISSAGDSAGNEVLLWIGPNMHLMQYPVRRSELYNQVAVFKSSRYLAGHQDKGDWGGPDELDAAFSTACPPVRDAVAQIGRARFWAMYDRSPIPKWSRDALLLIGDAAHPMLQYLGQGACQALEDAVEIGKQLVPPGSADGAGTAAAYRRFEDARIGRASRCQTIARPWGELWHTEDPLLTTVRNHLFAKRAPDDYRELDWLYGESDQLAGRPRETSTLPTP